MYFPSRPYIMTDCTFITNGTFISQEGTYAVLDHDRIRACVKQHRGPHLSNLCLGDLESELCPPE